MPSSFLTREWSIITMSDVKLKLAKSESTKWGFLILNLNSFLSLYIQYSPNFSSICRPVKWTLYSILKLVSGLLTLTSCPVCWRVLSSTTLPRSVCVPSNFLLDFKFISCSIPSNSIFCCIGMKFFHHSYKNCHHH